MSYLIPFLSFTGKASVTLEGETLARALRTYLDTGANLCGADGKIIATLVLEGRPYTSISNIGSRNDTLQAFNTDKGLYVQTGCFGPGPLSEFVSAVKEAHKRSIHAKAYLVAVELIKLVFKEP